MAISHLEVAIDACEDFECDFRGAGSKEATNGYFQAGPMYFENRRGGIELCI